MMKFSNVSRLFAVAGFAVLLSASAAARQIRLSNGQIMQGEIVGDITDDGFTFKRSDTGGQAFFRWSQIHADDVTSIRKVSDPDAGVKLVVMVKGDRLNLEIGSPVEGKVEAFGDYYIVRNLKSPGGRRVNKDELIDGPDAVQMGVDIDARVIWDAKAILEYERNQVNPETAQHFYALARLAEKLGLYEEAKGQLESCLAASPTPVLQARADSLKARLEVLIDQKVILGVIEGARKLAKDNAFQFALANIDIGLASKPDPEIAGKLKEVRDEIDFDYTAFVSQEWFDQMRPVALAFVKDKKEKKVSVQDARSFAQRPMTDEIVKAIAAQTNPIKDLTQQDPKVLADIQKRFGERLTNTKMPKLKERKASFGKDGWYQAVGGNLPDAGVKKVDPNANNGFPGGNNGNGNPRGPGGNGRNGNGSNGNGNGSRNSEAETPDYAGVAFQQPPQGGKGEGGGGGGPGGGAAGGGLPPGAAEAIAEALRKAAEKRSAEAAGNGGRSQIQEEQYEATDSEMKVPEEVPSLQEWWKALSQRRRADWLVAYYVRSSRAVDYLGRDHYRVRYR